MPTAEEAFLEAISAAPDDDGPRLMYADWLTERGDPKGEFITIQCDLAGMAATDPRRPMLERREQQLWEAHREGWKQPLRELGVTEVEYRRGLPEHIAIDAEQFLENTERIFALAPVRSARLVNTAGLVARLADSPACRGSPGLTLPTTASAMRGRRRWPRRPIWRTSPT